MIPYNTPADRPYTITGPAMVNIFAPTPRMKPSVLNSTAGAAMALAKPVMGTKVPAPANLAILSYRLNPVSSAEMATNVTEQAVPAVSLLRTLIPVQKELSHAADQSADQKGEKTVLGDGRIWRMALDQRIVLFCVHVRSLQRQFATFGEKYEQKTEEYLTGCLEMQTFVAYNGGRGEKNEGRGTF